jgi:hypothetical protein
MVSGQNVSHKWFGKGTAFSRAAKLHSSTRRPHELTTDHCPLPLAISTALSSACALFIDS